MPKHIILIITVILFASCERNNSQTASNTETSEAIVVNDLESLLNVQTKSFYEIDSSGVIMFPLSMAEYERSGIGRYYKDMPYGYWNIIFYDSKTKEYHLLSDRKMVVQSFNATYAGDLYNSQSAKHIFYEVRTDDFNRDKRITDDDPRYLFISDKAGNNFKQISPMGYNLNTWHFVKAFNKVVLTAAKDSDKNDKFNDSDEIAAFEIELDKDTVATEIFEAEFKKKLKQLYDKDWRRVND